MKNLILYILVIFTTLMACKKDNGNYKYTDNEQIVVSGMESSYTVISEMESLNITPEVTSTDPKAQFEYLWTMYETNASQQVLPVVDTLSRTKNLDYLIKQPAKVWVLVFEVTNKNTKYTKHFTSTINIITEFTRGWYVAKDDGSQSDLDLFLTPNSIVPEDKREDIYSEINGAKMLGTANLLAFLTSYKSTVTGELANTRALVMSTDKDMAAININTLKNILTFDNIFFDTPPTKGPIYVFPGSGAYYLINDGTVHVNVSAQTNIGMFGARLLRDANNNNYNLSKYTLTNSRANGYFYDETSSTFVGMSQGLGTVLSELTDVAGTSMSSKNTNQKALYLGLKTAVYLPAPAYRNAFTGCAVFQDKTDPTIKTLSHIDLDLLTIKMTNSPILPTEQLYNASDYTVLFGEENILYFATSNNQIWSRNLSNGFEKLEYTIPAGEELTFMRHRTGTETNYVHSFVVIGTKIGANYKIRMFNKSSGSITGEPAVTLEGTGIARDALYISPSTVETTNTIKW